MTEKENIMNVSEQVDVGDEEEHGRSLCQTPAVDKEYLVDLRARTAHFAAQKRMKIEGLVAMHESHKIRVKNARIQRGERLENITMEHRHIMEMVATLLGETYQVVEDGVIDEDIHLELLNQFMQVGGRRVVLFFFQVMPPPKLESGRVLPEDTPPFRRVLVTDGSHYPCEDRAVVVYRISNTEQIEYKNICDIVLYGTLEVESQDINILAAVQGFLARTSSKAVEAYDQWGELNMTEAGKNIRREFQANFKTFDKFIETTKSDLGQVIRFKFPDDIYEKYLKTPVSVLEISRNQKITEKVEHYGQTWFKQMESVLVEVKQIRNESHDVGPMAELEFWRKWLTKFNSVVEFIRSDKVKMCLLCMNLSRSKIYLRWPDLDQKITAAYNEAADNVKFLYALERFSEPLYRCSPITMGDHLPNLMNTIRMICVNSRYFKTTERVTAILVKVTNQIVIACTLYLTEKNTKTVWNYKKKEIISKMAVCQSLYTKYKASFQETQQHVHDHPEEGSFRVSESNIFAHFDSFRIRLEKLTDVLETYLTFAVLKSSTISGVDGEFKKLEHIFDTLVNKPYNALDHRTPHFDLAYEEFKKAVTSWEKNLRLLMTNMVATMPTVMEGAKILGRFEKIGLPCMQINKEYLNLVKKFYNEIAGLRDRYNEERQDCPVPKCMPPIAGRIYWIRSLYSRIQAPMEIFKSKKAVIEHPEAQKTIKLYNMLCTVFVHYELVHHEQWCADVTNVNNFLDVPLLSKHPRENITVNFDTFIDEVIRETEYMWKLGLKVPDAASCVTFTKDKLYRDYQVVKGLVSNYIKIRRSIPQLFVPLMRPMLHDLELVFNPGLSTITWISLEIPYFCEQVQAKLTRVETFIKEVMDMRAARVDEPLAAIAERQLIDLPYAAAITPRQFLDSNMKRRQNLEKELEKKLRIIEDAAIEIVDTLAKTFDAADGEEKMRWMDPSKLLRQSGSIMNLDGPDQDVFKMIEKPRAEDLPKFLNDCNDVFVFFFQRTVDALTTATKASLEALKKRALVSTVVTAEESTSANPLLSTDIELHIPNIVNAPSLDDIQYIFTKIIANMLNTFKEVTQWGQRHPHKISSNADVIRNYDDDDEEEGNEEDILSGREKEMRMEGESEDDSRITERVERLEGVEETSRQRRKKLRVCYKLVVDNKEVTRIILSLQGAMLLLAPDVGRITQFYLKYDVLWFENREQEVQAFVDKEPIYKDIKDTFIQLKGHTTSVDNIPTSHVVGPLQLNTGRLKEALKVKVQEWKFLLGKALMKSYGMKLKEIVDFNRKRTNVLNRIIKDLDDIRLAMNCLNLIREHFIDIDMELSLIEDTYGLFAEYGVKVPQEQQERVDSLRYNFEQMVTLSKTTQKQLVEIQEPFQKDLIAEIHTFSRNVKQFDRDFEVNGPLVPGLPASEASDRVMIFQMRLDDLTDRYDRCANGEKLFGLPITEYPILWEKKKQMTLLSKLYSLYVKVMRSIDGYSDLPWGEVDIEAIKEEITEFQNRCRRLPKGMKDWPAYLDLKQKIDDFNETCPLLELMADKSMKPRHWEALSKLTKCDFEVESDGFCLRNVLQAPLLKHREGVEDICNSAGKERDIETKLKQVIQEWSTVDLQFSNFKNRGEILLKGQETADIVTKLEESIMVLSSLHSNRYNTPFKKNIQLWMSKTTTTSEILETWIMVQNLWIYLEAVFVGGDISKQLPTESKRFASIDQTWVKIMYRARDTMKVIDVCVGDEMMADILEHLLEQLEALQKSLSGYLETKRLIFSRFFFVSDPALLEILGQASDSHTIQNHLLSVFENVNMVEFDEKSYDKIKAMYSKEMERIPLDEDVTAVGGVEIWLGKLLTMMQQSVNVVITDVVAAINETDFRLLDVLDKFPAQVGLLALQFLWTKDAELALKKCRIDKMIMKRTNKTFLGLLNLLIDKTTKELTKFERVKYETLVTIHVHQRDIFDELVRLKIQSVLDFEWLKQARFYWDDELDECWVKITDVDFLYQNEFLGCTERLVITPLTDRCYITLAQAVGMCMGGAPAGPAGTGKTETTKDMAKALGKYCVVFNCSDQMDFRGLGRIFKGLVQSGSWGCFDEFNRIDLPVLSVAAQQISIVFTAKKEKKSTFVFSDGDTITMNREYGIFLTMNPGYAGRQELPENLKIMFRTLAMVVPDRQIIIRVRLASCGFRENVQLARKFFTLYKLCEEQLSKQVHYDFGLRNILSVLRTVGAQRRARPKEAEETSIMRVLRDMNVSKLVDEDEPLFNSLIEDLFPGNKLSTSSYKDLQKAISAMCNETQLVNHPQWNLKLVQLYETSLVRHGLMVLGPTGSGKTTCIHGLMKAFTEMGHPHREMRMNPKAITAPQMFGRLDVATNDWTDGIFSTLWRRTIRIKKTESTWLVLDGPVDAVWIENLNSVLDDNKTLTLANGDRIPMAANCKILFEPDNVDNASPATISRMGMVYLSASVLNWETFLEGWLLTRPAESTLLKELFGKIYQDLNIYVQTKLVTKMALLEALYIRQCCDILNGLMDTNIEGQLPNTHLERYFLFALMWSLGAFLEIPEREKMESFVLAHDSKLKWPKLQNGESIFEYCVSDDGRWEHWRQRVVDYIYPSDRVPEYADILVPNVDNVRTAFLMRIIARQHKGVLLIGEQGTAKTVMIKEFLSNYDPEQQLSKSFNFSSATTPNTYQRVIESYVDKRVGTEYGPPNGRKMTVFIDDINMPVVNEWGDQITNELVRQLMEMGGFYSLEKPGDFLTILDMQFLAAMIQPGGGRNDIPARLKRHFCIFNCTLPSTSSMDKIFSVIAEGYFCEDRFNPDIVSFLPKLIPLTRLVWQATKTKILPTPAKFHYIFNLRDLSRIWQGILYIQSAECNSISTLLQLWIHECKRVISDRFVSTEEKEWFHDCLRRTASETLSASVFKNHYNDDETYFVDFLREPPEPTGNEDEDISLDAPKIYEQLPSYDVLMTKLGEFVARYNEEVRGSNLNLVFFHDALMHLMIISRVIQTPRGSQMLVGVGGSGKQSLTKLASFISNYRTHQITLSRAYNVGNFLDDLKYLYTTAGYDGRGMTFIFSDNDIKDEAFLEYLNNILSAGEVAGLFARDELDEITNDLAPAMKKVDPKRIPTNDNLYEFFITRARNNLHLVLCFSPVGANLRSRALKFPGLISGVTINWFQKWPKDALIAVSQHYLDTFKVTCTPSVKEELIDMMAFVHDGISETCHTYFERFRRQTFVTPKTFLAFLNDYKKIYTEKLNEINGLAGRMKVGLAKLVEAQSSVDVLKQELQLKEKDIAVASAEAEQVLTEVTSLQKAAGEVKVEVQTGKDKAEALVDDIAKDTAVAEGKLEAAKPALQAAEAALRTIKPTDIATVRKLGKPPYLITVIMDVVLILFQKKLIPVATDLEKNFLKTSWNESLKCMADTKFLWNLQHFPKDRINAETIDLIKPYLQYKDYKYEKARIACGNVAGLLKWTIAMGDFYQINKEVLPLKATLAIEQRKLSSAQKDLKQAQDLLAAKQKELDEVQAELDIAVGKKRAVLEDANKCKGRMDAASALIGGLAGERTRWTEQLGQFTSQIGRLVGDSLILTGFLSYTGPFNQEFRNMIIKSWFDALTKRKIPVTANFSIIDNLTDSATIGEWNLQGLPTDELSIQNGVIATRASRYPLLIDPQSQGKTWIKNMEKNNELQVTVVNHQYFRNHLEECVSLGKAMLIEDIEEELDPCLDNVLEKNYIKIGTSLKVPIGDKEIDIHSDFRLYITTKLPNPVYTPEIAARTSIVDFTVTIKGLEDQLLGRVIAIEKTELEVERTNLLESVTANKRKMKDLESNLLHKLSTVEGSLIDDETVMTVLNVSKDTAAEVREALQTAEETGIKINMAREEYRGVATRGSILYFLITDLTAVSNMYQTSLDQFLEKFDMSMERSEPNLITHKRIAAITDYLTYEIYKNQCRGLYEEHQFMFLLLMVFKIDLQREAITFKEFQTFVKGGAALDLNTVSPKPFKWITDTTWLNLVQLSSLRQFQYITTQIAANERSWKTWFHKEEPEEENIPDGYHSLDVFKKLLLVKCWCPDRTSSQARKYISISIGSQYTEPVILNYQDLLSESRPNTPMIGLLSMGSDPTPSIETLAKRNTTHCSSVSMGQGQEVHARKLLSKSMSEGGWVLLQNCHLGLEYMSELFLTIIETEYMDPTFRLFITTSPHPNFPISLLQISIRFTNEPPQGIRAGLKRTYSGLGQDVLDYSDTPQYLYMLYSISFLHTVVQERRKFGPLGWNIPYEFNSSDWLASVIFSQNHLEHIGKSRPVSWVTVRYMLGEIHYGGRITDDYDKRLLNAFAKMWFTEDMFSEDFAFSKNYPAMHYKHLHQYLEAFEEMSSSDPPQVYGLHSNANITYQTNTTRDMLDGILLTQPKEAAAGGGETREDSVMRQVKEMLGKLPKEYDPHETKQRLKIMGITSPMNIFLRQEIDRMQRVITLIRKTLTDLLLAIEGTIIMNESLRDAFDAIYDAKIPNKWLRGSWTSSTIGFWFTELLERNVQFSAWLYNGRPNQFWMTGFFNPQGFLTAMRQEVARAHKGWPLDSVVLHNDVLRVMHEECKGAPLEGVYVYGLYVDGAGWDKRNGKLVESRSKMVNAIMPVIHMYAINTNETKKDPKSGLYQCPVYKKPNRTNLTFITPLWLNSNLPPHHWILRGVALLCDIK